MESHGRVQILHPRIGLAVSPGGVVSGHHRTRPPSVTMKQYKLTSWPDLPTRFSSTAMRRAVSELSQRFASARDLARSSGAATREVEALIQHLHDAGMLMTREAPQTAGSGNWRDWGPLAAVRELVRR